MPRSCIHHNALPLTYAFCYTYMHRSAMDMRPVRRYELLVICFLSQQYGCIAMGTSCDHSVSNYLLCDEATFDWLLKNGIWANNVSGEILVAFCPSGFCTYNVSGDYLRIPSDVTDIGNYACNITHRTGITCGACQQHFGPAFNSDTFDCVPCNAQSSKTNWIYYVLSVYMPLFVVFLLIVAFDVHLTSGPFNAFILYAQTISTTLDLNADGVAPLAVLFSDPATFQKVYQIIYSPFNLNIMGNLIPKHCLNSSLTSLDMLVLKYLEALFPLLMIIVVVVLVKFCSSYPAICLCLKKYKFRTSLVQVFAAFVLLSYNRFCEITVYLLSPVPLWNESLHTIYNMVYFYGNFHYDDRTYSLGYKLPAWMVMILLILLPVALLHYPLRWWEHLVTRVRCLQRVYPTTSIAILLDAFQGCFKDDRRYFAGLYLGFRLLFLAAYTQPVLLQYLFQQIIITSFILLFAVLRPYKNKRLNSVDVAIFVNMALINSFVWYTVVETDTNRGSLKACLLVECILVLLPMVCILCYILWHCSSRHRSLLQVARCCFAFSTWRKYLFTEFGRENAIICRAPSTETLLDKSSDGPLRVNTEDVAYLYGIEHRD